MKKNCMIDTIIVLGWLSAYCWLGGAAPKQITALQQTINKDKSTVIHDNHDSAWNSMRKNVSL